ncbi:FAD-dependent oxidoreductase [Nocardia alni]|uniref:FAD-dependent oxidoreductase n=1 Tax=Nocardia alni TaxID=2815723 RepID=UPI001C2162FC|nr:FAD-dependent oxidoreductase [Nocardia alni]
MSSAAPAEPLPERVDVLVAGSGAAGLTAALAAVVAGARVLLVESAAEFGGTTALGGGRVWVPVNGTAANAGDSAEAARTYLRAIFDSRYPEFVDMFVESAPEMMAFVQRHSAHRFVVCPNYPDYHTELPGVTLGGRCLDMEPARLGDLAPQTGAIRVPPGYSPMTHAEWERWRYPDRFDHELLSQRMRDGIRTGGVALVAGLLDGVVRAGVRVYGSTPLVGVLVDEGRVRGAEVQYDGSRVVLHANAIVLATGGFDWDARLREDLLPGPLATSTAAPSNTGTALRIARELGAAVDNTAEGWWMPAISIPGDTVDGHPYARALIRERGTPRQILVNRAGRRFVDESVPYNEFGKALHHRATDGSYPNRDAFLIFDDLFRRRYPLPGLPPGAETPDWVARSDDLRGLAARIGVDPGGLCGTVERWNMLCKKGIDEDFRRGDNPYDRYYGDPDQPGNPNLGPIDTAPYYAVQVLPGTIGTKGGPVTDLNGQVQRPGGVPIAGLFAAGNASAFWTADGYPGPGATLAVAMTMGARAGRAAARLR